MSTIQKRVMLLNFPLLDVGGITTWSHQIIKGFQKIGWQADHYYCTPTGRYKSSETDFMPIGDKFKRGEKIPSKTLGYHGDENVAYYKELLKSYDFVVFVHPSPHPTKANKKDERIISWQNLYKECSIPKVVIFHDKKWHKTNRWFKEVHDYIDVVLAAQHNFIESVNQYSGLGYCEEGCSKLLSTDWLYFPIDTDGCSISNERQQQFCMMPQWIKWKNHSKILNVADQIKLPIHFYNGGMEYHKLAWTELWMKSIRVDWVEDTYINREAKHEYHGFVTYEKVKEVYRKSLGSIDLTTRTYQNYTHHESSLYGCVLLCTEECRQGPYNHICEGEYWPIDMNNISKSINDFIDLPENLKEEIRQKAFIRTKENFACEKIAQKILDIVQNVKR